MAKFALYKPIERFIKGFITIELQHILGTTR